MNVIENEDYSNIDLIEDNVGDFFLPYSITILEKDNDNANASE